MKITEIFKSIQGEGPYIGTPMTFVRLAGCNLDPPCSWCDTKYSWDVSKALDMTPKEVGLKIMDLKCKTLCFTGGEPLAQNSELSELITRLDGFGFDLHIETNGTIVPMGECQNINKWSISPKEETDTEVVNRILDNINGELADVWIKFVVSSSAEVQGIPVFMSHLDYKIDVVVQPERFAASQSAYISSDVIENPVMIYLRHLKEVTGWCHKHLGELNWRVLPQLHYLLWGGKKGV